MDIYHKIFYGSLMLNLDKERVLGLQDTSTLSLIRTINKNLLYAKEKYLLGNNNYYSIIKNLEDKLNTLKRCPEICNYNTRLLFSYSCSETN